MPQLTDYTARFHRPDWLIRASDNTIELETVRNGKPAIPTEGTVSVYDDSSTAIVDGESVTVSDGKATYTISAATLPTTLELSNAWRIEWTLTMPDGFDHVFLRDAALVIRKLYPVVAVNDLKRLHSEVIAWFRDDATRVQDHMDSAWADIEGMLLGQGRLPYKILSPWSLRSTHLFMSLAYLFRDMAASSSTDGKYGELAKDYAKKADDAFADLVIKYDYANDGTMNDKLESGEASVWLCVPGGWYN